jgi:uncharacterized protein (TIGR02231 family)
MTRKIILSTTFALSVIASYAQSTQAKLENVTVYNTAAELNHSARVSIGAGNSEVIIKNLSNSIDPNSIQIGSDRDITIMSVTTRREFTEDFSKNPEVKKLQDSIKFIQKEKSEVINALSSIKNAISILDANKIVRGEHTGLNVSELQKMLDYYLIKHKELSSQAYTFQEKDIKYQEQITRIQNRINELSNDPSLSKGEIVLQVISPSAGVTNFDVSYLSYQASWSPIYDLKAKDTKSPLKIIYKSNIVQNTGINWDKVKLTISTSNPSQSGQAPILSTWFLNYYQQQYAKFKAGAYQQAAPSLSNTIQSLSRADMDGRDEDKPVSDFVQVNETALNATFEIDLLYDIPSDGKEHSVSMKEYEVNAYYKYYAVPKLDKDVFLLAEIANWEDLNLIPGPANIIFDGKYVGKSFIDPNSTQDTLNISLGRDKKIIVKREKLQDFSSSKLIGNNKQHKIAYEIRIKNTRKESIQLLLKDQHPMSTNKDIEIDIDEISGATRNEETGVLTWPLEIGSNELKKVRVGYTVKHPKDKVIDRLF